MQKSDFRTTGIQIEPLGRNPTTFEIKDSTNQDTTLIVTGDIKATGTIYGKLNGTLVLNRQRLTKADNIYLNPTNINTYIFFDAGQSLVSIYTAPLPLQYNGMVIYLFNEDNTASNNEVRMYSVDNLTGTNANCVHKGKTRFDGNNIRRNGGAWVDTFEDRDDVVAGNDWTIHRKQCQMFLINTTLISGTIDSYETVFYSIGGTQINT